MEISIKATLCEGTAYQTLYYNLQYKLDGKWFYRKCGTLSLIRIWDNPNMSDAQFRERIVEKLNSLSEEEVEEMIIERVKRYLKQQKIDNSNKSEYDRLVKRFGSLKFKVKI